VCDVAGEQDAERDLAESALYGDVQSRMPVTVSGSPYDIALSRPINILYNCISH